MMRLMTERLDLLQLDVRALDAWLDKDPVRLTTATGARFRLPIDAPPLLGEDLPAIRGMVASGGAPLGAIWLFTLRETREPVGAGGFFPRGDGVHDVGYSIWPHRQRNGYASEAVKALCDWALAQPGVRGLRATIPPEHAPSIKVAEHAGFSRAGVSTDPAVGEVAVFERTR